MSPLPLTGEDIAAFRRAGYHLHHEQLFGEDDLWALEQIFEGLVASNPELQTDELSRAHEKNPLLLDYLMTPQVLDLVESVIGPNIVVWGSHFIGKPARVGRATPWHEDSSYWKNRLDRYDGLVSVWLALDDSNRENGCLQVIPGSHLDRGFARYVAVERETNTFPTQLEGVEARNGVCLELRRGECSLHDGRIVHGAAANTSRRRRLGFVMRYVTAGARINPEVNGGMRFWLARGRPLAPNTYENA